jgi:hypothetical protein
VQVRPRQCGPSPHKNTSTQLDVALSVDDFLEIYQTPYIIFGATCEVVPLVDFKIRPRDPGIISPQGKHISETLYFCEEYFIMSCFTLDNNQGRGRLTNPNLPTSSTYPHCPQQLQPPSNLSDRLCASMDFNPVHYFKAAICLSLALHCLITCLVTVTICNSVTQITQ